MPSEALTCFKIHIYDIPTTNAKHEKQREVIEATKPWICDVKIKLITKSLILSPYHNDSATNVWWKFYSPSSLIMCNLALERVYYEVAVSLRQ